MLITNIHANYLNFVYFKQIEKKKAVLESGEYLVFWEIKFEARLVAITQYGVRSLQMVTMHEP